MVGGLVEIAAACERLWQSQSGMNLDFPSPDTKQDRCRNSLPATMANLATRIAAVDFLGGRREYRILSGMGTWLWDIADRPLASDPASARRQGRTDAAEQIECDAWSRSTGQLRGIGSKTERVIYCRTSYIKSSTHLT